MNVLNTAGTVTVLELSQPNILTLTISEADLLCCYDKQKHLVT